MGELLKSLSENPEQIEGFTSDQIAEAREALNEFSAALKAGEVEAGSEAIAEATALAAKLTEREQAIEADEAARLEEIANLDAALGLTVEEEAEIVADEVPVESEDDEDAEEEDEEVEDKTPVVVASSGPSLREIAAKAPRQSKPVEEEPAVLVASGGRFDGQALTASSYAEMAQKAWRANPGKQVLATAEIQHKYTLTDDPVRNAEVLANLTADAQQDIMVAAGGICAPPEVLYRFFNVATTSGILQLPSVNAPRGAVSIPVSPSLGDILGQSGIATEWTAANDADPTPSPATKPVYIFECPDFEDCTVSAWPTILQFGNFAARFFPEAIANVTGLAVVAAARTLNAARLAFITAAAVAGNVTDTGGGGLNQLTTNLGGNANDYRATYGMSRDAILDVALPAWVPDALLADAIARDSTTEYGDIRGKIDGLFNSLRLRPQWVYDLDDQTDGDFENVANVLMWAPGTVVELDGGTLDLGVVRDSTLNASNNYQTFVEPFVGWCVPGHEIRSLAIEVCPSGATGDRVTIACSNNS